jgi:uncharacterized membrane-anchored protein
MTKRILFLIGLLIEMVLLLGLLVPQEMIMKTGTDVTLRTMPVDPRSMLRGDYVTLTYEIGRDYVPPSENFYGELVVTLEGSGEDWKRVNVQYERPVLSEVQVCLRAYPTGFGTMPDRLEFPDIAQFFVEEDAGHEFENATRQHLLLVDISVDAFCNARIKGVHLGPEVPPGAEIEIINPVEGRPVPTKPVPAPAT